MGRNRRRYPADPMKGRVQLWSSHYAPEPTGIGPVSRVLATALAASDWDVEVIAAHPHYPERGNGGRLRPSRELRDGIPVLRLPIYAARDSAGARLLQETSFTLCLLAALPFLGRPPLRSPDVIVAASPSFLSLLQAIVAARPQTSPGHWLHDLLPDSAHHHGPAPGGRVPRSGRRDELEPDDLRSSRKDDRSPRRPFRDKREARVCPSRRGRADLGPRSAGDGANTQASEQRAGRARHRSWE